MRWSKFRKYVKKYLAERLTLTIIPHSKGTMHQIHLPRVVYIVLLLFLTSYLVGVTYQYKRTAFKYEVAKTIIVDLQSLKVENMSLKTGLVQVVKETERMREILQNLEEKGEQIEELISDNDEMDNYDDVKNLVFFNYTLLAEDYDQPLGGGDDLLREDAFEMLTQIREDLRMLRVDIPFQQEVMEDLEVNIEDYNALMAATPMGWPLKDDGKGYISSQFGFRKDPITNKQAFHEGLDIGVWYGTPVIATAAGKVVYADWRGGYGRMVMIDHGYGYQTYYAHNNKLVVKSGQTVKRGDIVAYSGNSGKSTGPHLHYEVRVNGVPKNPRDFLKTK
ncbi:MAG: M23 family metallopeptidase [Halanaerobiales bacterium]|nr:M23 family metallopeptidase [Halanaerobiales bacterium]